MLTGQTLALLTVEHILAEVKLLSAEEQDEMDDQFSGCPEGNR